MAINYDKTIKQLFQNKKLSPPSSCDIGHSFSSGDPDYLSTHVLVFIHFSAENWQGLFCCECRSLYICTAFE